jgi:mono/diheme cytochrome c family protein
LCAPAAAAALIILLCGCGHRDHQATLAQRGGTLFASACAGCHTLTGHDTQVAGGDLAIAALSARALESFIRVMPVRLSPPEIGAVAAYVHTVAAARRGD